MLIEVLGFEDAQKRQSEILKGESRSICTKFCQSSFLRYHERSLERNFSTKFLYYKNENLQSLLPLSISNSDSSSAVSHFGSPYGGVCINTDQPENIRQAYEAYFNYMSDTFPELGSFEVRLPPAVVRPSVSSHEWSLWALGYQQSTMYFGRYFTPTLTPKLNRNRKRRIGKIDTSTLTLGSKLTPNHDEYLVLVGNRQKRHSVVPTHSLQDFETIESLFPGTINTHSMKHDSTICSVAIVFEDNSFSTIQYLAGTECSFNCGSQDLLVNHLVKSYLESGKTLLFGTSTQPDQNHRALNVGLDNFKESFGAIPYSCSRWIKEFPRS